MKHLPKIIIQPKGRLANQMFQLMVALEIKKKIPDIKIYGYRLDEWGLVAEQLESSIIALPYVVIRGNNFHIDQIVDLIHKESIQTIIIEGWGMRLDNFSSYLHYSNLFESNIHHHSVDDSEILLNIRSEDILSGWHSLYYPIPYSYYQKIIETTRLKPVFMGQLESNPYTDGLRKQFSGATFIEKQTPMEDFQMIRNAKNVALSISSFSWLAAWISTIKDKKIHYPVCGLLDPRFGRSMLMPVNDSRYTFYDAPFLKKEHRKTIDMMKWVSIDHSINKLSDQEIEKMTKYLNK